MVARRCAILVSLAVLAVGAGEDRAGAANTSCQTGPVVQWTPESGGNGHFYQAVCPEFFSTWTAADSAARSAGRHLATITSAGENAFVFALIDDPTFWDTNANAVCNDGPWLGGFQEPAGLEPDEGWVWVDGEAFGFTAWHSGQPDDFAMAEDNLHFFDCSGPTTRSAQWNDAAGTGFRSGYVVEWEHSLDVDLDGELDPLTDGLLVPRHLFGFTGTTLTDDAVDLTDCKRCAASTIEPFLGALAAGAVHDATADWSDADNPTGPWSYLQGTTPLAHQSSWVPGSFPGMQPAWATAASGAGHVPAFFQALSAADDYLAGDVVIHSRDDGSGGGQGDARLRFTAPATGIYRVDLDIWIARDISRSVPWTLAAEGTPIDTGTVASGDAFSRSNPDGASGSVALAQGDTVDLVLNTPGGGVPGDLVGAKLRLEAFGIDVDGNGKTLPLTDGILILRRLSGITGPALVDGAVDLAHCTRCTAEAIQTFFAGLGVDD
jgi:hypothetical protein